MNNNFKESLKSNKTLEEKIIDALASIHTDSFEETMKLVDYMKSIHRYLNNYDEYRRALKIYEDTKFRHYEKENRMNEEEK